MTLGGQTVVVTGASRGFGRAISTALVRAKARVSGIARSADALGQVRDELGAAFEPVVGDATDQALARTILQRDRPVGLVLNAGASPMMAPLREQTWDSFRGNWEVDTRQAFGWTVEALRQPMAPGSTVILVSSAAALAGSPLSGGYAPAKSAMRHIRNYAAAEAARLGLSVRFVTLLPHLTTDGGVGRAGAAAYAEQGGMDVETFLQGPGPLLQAKAVGRAVVDLISKETIESAEYVLTGNGPEPSL